MSFLCPMNQIRHQAKNWDGHSPCRPVKPHSSFLRSLPGFQIQIEENFDMITDKPMGASNTFLQLSSASRWMASHHQVPAMDREDCHSALINESPFLQTISRQPPDRFQELV
jgi:hypothetical protein